MPEVVSEYSKKQDLLGAREFQNEILKAYMLDFAKHAPAQYIMKISTVWNVIPTQLAKENKKFVYSAIRESARTREYGTAIQWLIDAGLIYPVFNITAPKLPLKGYLDQTAFKTYCLDVGLLGAMSKLSHKIILQKEDLFTEFKGALTENLAVQLLKSRGIEDLFYWTSGNVAEVDFVLPIENKIYPLEVKASVSTKKKSLMVYDKKYFPETLSRATLRNLKKRWEVM